MDAVSHNRVDQLRTLLAQGGNPNAQDQASRTALSQASFYDHVECVKLLLEKGAKMNVRDYYDLDDVAYASANGRHESLALLIHSGADIHGTYPSDMLPENKQSLLLGMLETACHDSENEKNQDYLKTAQLLIDQGIDLNFQDDFGNYALIHAGWNIAPCSIDIAVLLLEHRADGHLQTSEGRSFFNYTSPDFINAVVARQEARQLSTLIDNTITTTSVPLAL